MAQLIRNYRAGQKIVLSDEVRRQGTAAVRAQQQSDEGGQRQAADLLAEAEAEARAIIEQAREEAATVEATAQARGFEAGFQQGIAEGRAAGEQAIAEGVTAVHRLLDELQTQRRQRLAASDGVVADLAMAVAERVVGQITTHQRETILHTVGRALDELGTSGPFSLRVHPDDAAYLRAHWQQDGEGDGMEWQIVDDASIHPGGCLLSCGPASIDARIPSQLQAIVDGLQLTNTSGAGAPAADRD